MKVKREYYKSAKDLPCEEELSPGAPLCAGCGGLMTLRLMHKVMGENVVNRKEKPQTSETPCFHRLHCHNRDTRNLNLDG